MGFQQSLEHLSGARPMFAIICLSLLACKLGKSDDDPESRPLPVVEESAPAPVQATPPATATAVPQAATPPAATSAAKADEPTKPAEPSAAAPKADAAQTGGQKDTSKPDTTKGGTTGEQKTEEKPDDKSADNQGTTGAAPPTIKAPSAECVSKCSAALQACLADAKLGDNVAQKCQGAFQSCQKDCS